MKIAALKDKKNIFFDLAAEFWKALNKEILIRARLPEKGVRLGKSLINLR